MLTFKSTDFCASLHKTFPNTVCEAYVCTQLLESLGSIRLSHSHLCSDMKASLRRIAEQEATFTLGNVPKTSFKPIH